MLTQLPKYIPIGALTITIIAFLHLQIYYSSFGIDIFSYLTVSELILLVAPFLIEWALWLVFPYFLFAGAADVFNKKIHWFSVVWLVIISAPAYLVLIRLPVVIGMEVIWPLFIFLLVQSIIFFIVGAIQGVETKKIMQTSEKYIENIEISSFVNKKSIYGFLIVATLGYALAIAQVRVNTVKLSASMETEYRIELQTGEIIETDDDLRFLGSSKSHMFLYDREFDRAILYSQNDVKRLEVCKFEDTPILGRIMRLTEW